MTTKTVESNPNLRADDRYKEIAQPDVPILDQSEVHRIIAQLQAERDEAVAKADFAQKRLTHVTDIPHGVAQPEPADSFVEADDIDSFPQLNQLNSRDVVQNATRAGKYNYQRSHVTHRNEVPHDHRGAPATTVWMYDEGGWARRIQRQSLDSAVAAGLFPTCPNCDGWHKDSETNPNACPAKKPISYTQCSICAAAGYIRYIWDLQDKLPLDKNGEDIQSAAKKDPMFITSIELPSTPEQRLRVKLESHIKIYHPATASSMRLNSTNDVTV